MALKPLHMHDFVTWTRHDIRFLDNHGMSVYIRSLVIYSRAAQNPTQHPGCKWRGPICEPAGSTRAANPHSLHREPTS